MYPVQYSRSGLSVPFCPWLTHYQVRNQARDINAVVLLWIIAQQMSWISAHDDKSFCWVHGASFQILAYKFFEFERSKDINLHINAHGHRRLWCITKPSVATNENADLIRQTEAILSVQPIN